MIRSFAIVACLVIPGVVMAQDSTATDSVFLRAQRLVAEGQGDSGRALVQQALDSAPPGSSRYAEALYWHAVVAATAADAERDLRTIVVSYPLSARSADALLRLAQLEMTRGDDDQALEHLQRILVEHPDSPDKSRAEFWMARVLFDKGNAPRACARLADAARSTPASQVELRNQIDYLNQQCAGVDTTAVVPASGARASGGGAKSAPPRAAGAKPVAPAAGGRWTIQVAAYSTHEAAERLRSTLAKRGYDARVVGSAKPFRVRVGRYATREAADAAATKMRADKLSAYVTEAESP